MMEKGRSLGPRGRRRRRARSDGGLRTKGRVARTPGAAEGRCGELAGLCVTGWRRRVARTRRARRDGGRGLRTKGRVARTPSAAEGRCG
ncbi:hypothetical protein CesoFtcFv8_027083 [Champsocephalus esox]|uniref:Uncharacterized protein n=1 Tax=Champsocephalus esox TaxID=159716 RepID=A0AAN8B0E9_9TELE|nr:hypothetical protein CesoFtcFv8_027083 [Champsocephalus esox]